MKADSKETGCDQKGRDEGMRCCWIFQMQGLGLGNGVCVGEGEGEDKMNRLLCCREILSSDWIRVVLLVRDVMSLYS